MVHQIQTGDVIDTLCAFAFSVFAWTAIYVFETLYQAFVRACEDEREWKEHKSHDHFV